MDDEMIIATKRKIEEVGVGEKESSSSSFRRKIEEVGVGEKESTVMMDVGGEEESVVKMDEDPPIPDDPSELRSQSPRARGLIGRLANHPFLSRNCAPFGEKGNEIKKLLVELQVWCDDYEVSKEAIEKYSFNRMERAWYDGVKQMVDDIENLFQDVEFEDLASGRSELSSMLPSSVWEQLLTRQRSLDDLQRRYGFSKVLSLDERVGDVLCRLEDLIEVITKLRSGVRRNDIDQLATRANGDDEIPFTDLEDQESYCHLPWNLKRCTAFCGFLLPSPFEKNFVVLLWVSLGFVLPVEGKELEDVASIYFDRLLRGSFFCVHQFGGGFNRPTLYKVSNRIVKSMPRDSQYFMLDGVEGFKISEREKARHVSLHTSLHTQHCYKKALERASESTGLLSLLLVGGQASSIIDHVSPPDLFLRLRYLRVLDLSWSGLCHFPSYVCDLLHLTYLDISYTRIKKLPLTLSNLVRLRTFRSQSCSIAKFPENFLNLINLRHLDFFSVVAWISTPPYIGRLTLLQTLSEYIVSKHSGCTIAELGGLNNLRGQLCISNLHNVESVDEAKKAKMDLKEFLESLVLLWTDGDANYSAVEGLRPHYNLRKLRMDYFGGSCFPTWLSDPGFTNLAAVSLNFCAVMELPLLGHLPSIKYLKLGGMSKIKQFEDKFWRFDIKKKSFPVLETLDIYSMSNLEEWGVLYEGDFPSLQKLSVSHCPKLKNIPDCMISSLHELDICSCPEIQSLPESGAPATVQYLSIFHCPNLSIKYYMKGVDRQKVAHVPDLRIDLDI